MSRRPNGEGSVFYDAARRCWVGVLDIGPDPETHRRRRRKVSAPTKTECREKLAELRAEYRKAGTVGRRDLTVRQVLGAWTSNMPESIRSERSVEVYLDAAARICDGARGVPGIGNRPYAKLTPGDVEAQLTAMAAAGYAASTIRQMRSVGIRAERRARRSGLTGRQPFELAEMPRGAAVRRSKSLTTAQLGALLALELTPWWRAWIVTAVQTGLRPGELAGLRWQDYDAAPAEIRVRKSLKRGPGGRMVLADLKTEASKRTVAVPAMTRAVLDVHRRAQAAARLAVGPAWHDLGLVFCGPSGSGMSDQAIGSQFRQLCGLAGIGEDWTLRETRHTFVSMLSDAGVEIEQIADAVGHINSRVTQVVYRHQLADKVSQTAEAMDRILPPDGGQ
jgi:integrase